jgi:hypothetical protein
MISFGIALVAGKNRVPIPATGKTALVTRLCFGLVVFRIFTTQWPMDAWKFIL